MAESSAKVTPMEFSPEQKGALNEFQKRMATVADKELQHALAVVAQGHPEKTFCRFLWARDWDVDKSWNMMMECLKWRVANKVDSILERPIEPEKLVKMRESLLAGVSGYCKQGRPVTTTRLGLSNVNKAKEITIEDWVNAHIQLNEYRDTVAMPASAARLGRPVTTSIRILDTTGLTMAHLVNLKLFKAMSLVDEANYPERSDHFFIVNAPWAFVACFKVVKPLLNPRTIAKVRVLSGNGLKELLEYIDEDQLPDFIRKDKVTPEQEAANFSGLQAPFHKEMQAYIQRRAQAAANGEKETKQSETIDNATEQLSGIQVC